MASILAKLPPPILFNGRRPIPVFNFQRVTLLAASAKAYRKTTVTGDSSGRSPTSLSFVESVQELWNKPENLYAAFGLGLTAVFYLHATVGLIAVIEKLPLIAYVFQAIGVLYTFWFVWRYLLYRPTREELYDIVKTYGKDIL